MNNHIPVQDVPNVVNASMDMTRLVMSVDAAVFRGAVKMLLHVVVGTFSLGDRQRCGGRGYGFV